MMTDMKTCSVRLNRNFLASVGTLKVNLNPLVVTTNSDFGSKEASFLRVSDENNKSRRKERVNYNEETSNKYLHSDSSDDYSSSSDEETDGYLGKKAKPTFPEREEPKKLKCLRCDECFTKHAAYLIHQRSHSPQKFKCILCGIRSDTRQSYIYHMKRLHPEVKPFVCEYPPCQLSFKTQKYLEEHIKSHKKYMCRFCKKLFFRKYRMRQHVAKYH